MSEPSISWPLNRPTQRQPPWAPSTTHDVSSTSSAQINGVLNGHASSSPTTPLLSPFPSTDPSLLPNGAKSLSGISLRAHILGLVLGLSVSLTAILLTVFPSPLWRAPFFLTALSLFHFLEYYSTARYNTPAANTSAFLLTQNGSAYNVAHSLALVECLVGQSSWLRTRRFVPESWGGWVLVLGFMMILVGQVTRSMAMAQAGNNFNHTVQIRKKQGHELVQDGVYACLRHPSYFGFWWWGLGTQVVLGNGICLVGYTVVLWRFFRYRIEKEEKLLIKFFGDEYVVYRERTWVGIPFIR